MYIVYVGKLSRHDIERLCYTGLQVHGSLLLSLVWLEAAVIVKHPQCFMIKGAPIVPDLTINTVKVASL